MKESQSPPSPKLPFYSCRGNFRIHVSLMVFLFVALVPFKEIYAAKAENKFISTQQSSISGTITDELGVPLPGASIVEKGTTNGTQSDFDGNYTLDLSSSNSTLVISYIGYEAQEISKK